MAEQQTKSPPKSSDPRAGSRGNGFGNGFGAFGGQDWLMAMGVGPDAMRAQTEAWLNGQTEFLAGMHEMMTDGMERYREGTAAATRSFERLCACTDGPSAFEAYREWLTGGLGFVMSDLAALQEQTARMAELSRRTLGAFAPPESDDA
jgi:hypothetical protein